MGAPGASVISSKPQPESWAGFTARRWQGRGCPVFGHCFLLSSQLRSWEHRVKGKRLPTGWVAPNRVKRHLQLPHSHSGFKAAHGSRDTMGKGAGGRIFPKENWKSQAGLKEVGNSVTGCFGVPRVSVLSPCASQLSLHFPLPP